MSSAAKASPNNANERFGKDFPSGHVLFREGDAGKTMYVIQSGKVRIAKRVRDVEKTLVVLGAGEFFGEMAVLNDESRSASAIIEEDARLLLIDPQTFEAMIRGNVEIAIRLIKKLAHRLKESNRQIENLLLRDNKSRVVHFLASTAEREGMETPEGKFVELSVKDLAGKVGLDEDAVQEVLDHLGAAHLVQVQAGGINVRDTEKLRMVLEYLEMKEKFGDL